MSDAACGSHMSYNYSTVQYSSTTEPPHREKNRIGRGRKVKIPMQLEIKEGEQIDR